MPLCAHVVAPAKVNLGLRVLGRRADGYHLLTSRMTFLTLSDRMRLHVNRAPSDGVTLLVLGGDFAGSLTPRESTDPLANLTSRAAARFLEATREWRRDSWSVRIELEKRIPIGAGLGGGSSDAASVLLALNRIFGGPLDSSALLGLGVTLGADVPFFLGGRAAVVGGIGEVLAPPSRLEPARAAVVAFAGSPLGTAAVFSLYDESAEPRERAPGNSGDEFGNDLEAAAETLEPRIGVLKRELLRLGASRSLMTGSGAAVVGLFDSPLYARRAAKLLQKTGIWARSVYTAAVSFASM